MKELLISDYNEVHKFLNIADYEGYNSNFITMMMWNHEYNIQYEIHDNFMIMLQHFKNEYHFAMPFCKPEYYKEAIDYMINYAKEHNFKFSMDCVVSPVKEFIKENYGDKFLYLHTINSDDYVYEKSALESLSGKKMQKRRNHYNAFIKEYADYIYKEIEDEDIDNVLTCLQGWDLEHDNQDSVESEFTAIMYLLVNRKELDIRTGCIYINGILEAFIIGSPLRHQTIQIHVEKANKNIRGLYVAIGKFFLEANYSDYLYVNREEDMGIEYLRKAKLSLHPIKMIEKYRIELNDLKISLASSKDEKDIIKLWQDNFNDEDEISTKFYFDFCYSNEHTYLLKHNDLIVSALQIVPFELENELVYFILGVSTKKLYQRNGCMKKLMNYVLSIEPYKDHNIILQAYNYEIYRQFGFNKKYYHQLINVDSSAYDYNSNIYEKEISSNELLNLYNNYCINYNGYRIRSLDYYQRYLINRCFAFNDKIVGIFNQNDLIGYVIYHQDELVIKISEIIYINQLALNDIVAYFACKQQDLIIECDLLGDIKGNSELICTMMSNDIDKDMIDNKLYINELY